MVTERLKGQPPASKWKSNPPGPDRCWHCRLCPSLPCCPQDSPSNVNFRAPALHFIERLCSIQQQERKPRSPCEMCLFGPPNTLCWPKSRVAADVTRLRCSQTQEMYQKTVNYGPWQTCELGLQNTEQRTLDSTGKMRACRAKATTLSSVTGWQASFLACLQVLSWASRHWALLLEQAKTCEAEISKGTLWDHRETSMQSPSAVSLSRLSEQWQ